jgi:hypothetical protein
VRVRYTNVTVLFAFHVKLKNISRDRDNRFLSLNSFLLVQGDIFWHG